MVTIIFETHSTTKDNVRGIASGQNDAPLSPLGEQQAAQLGQRRADEHFDLIFCSDLQRSYRTAELAFPNLATIIIRDPRLRECDYGDWTGQPEAKVRAERAGRITLPFPGGESYEITTNRMQSFLRDLLTRYDGKRVLVIGHRATQYALEHCCNRVPLPQTVTASWQWQPGWKYQLRQVA